MQHLEEQRTPLLFSNPGNFFPRSFLKFFEHLPLRVIGPNQGMCPFLNNLCCPLRNVASRLRGGVKVEFPGETTKLKTRRATPTLGYEPLWLSWWWKLWGLEPKWGPGRVRKPEQPGVRSPGRGERRRRPRETLGSRAGRLRHLPGPGLCGCIGGQEQILLPQIPSVLPQGLTFPPAVLLFPHSFNTPCFPGSSCLFFSQTGWELFCPKIHYSLN